MSMKKVRIVFPDLNGCLRGKILPEDQFNQNKNIRIPRSVLSQDIEGEEADVLEEFSPSYHDKDLLVVPDESTLFESPHANDMKSVMADAREQDNTDHPVAPRTILKRAVAELAELGYEMKIASEIEFYLTDLERNLMLYSDIDMPFGDVNSIDSLNDFIAELETATKAIGLTTESILNEAGAGQLEITYGAMDPLNMADKTTFFKQAVRDIAKKHGMGATFLAKPDVNNVSSSQHMHMSLWKDGAQVSADDKSILNAMIAGQARYAHDSFALYCPNPNSFRRYVLGKQYVSERPDWGDDNRRSSLRVTGDEGNTHIENRIPGADANIYLVSAAIIFASIEGIKANLTLESPEVVEASNIEFPMSMNDAINLFENSDFIVEHFGKDFTTLYAGIKHEELLRFSEQITDWERQTFGKQV